MATEEARAIEAILMVAEEPIEPQLLGQLLEMSPKKIEELCSEIELDDMRRGRKGLAEIGGRMHHAPGTIHPLAVFKPHQENARAVEDIHVSETGASDVIFPVRLFLHSERDEKIAIDVLHVEGRESGGNLGIREGARGH